MTSNLSAFAFIQERSEATPGLWNNPFSILSANIAAIDSNVTFTFPSTETLSIFSNVDASQNLHAGNRIGVGAVPSSDTVEVMTIGADSSVSDYILFHDPSGSRSNYILGSRVGGTADGLNLYDQSGTTMIVSFSKQSIRFFQNVVGPVFDVGGALADTLNAATFGTGADSIESRIQAAISQASTDGISRVYVPANMYPYSAGSISFDTTVQMVREGGEWTVHDVWAYGAAGNNVRDDTAAIQAGISNASGAGGGVIYIPGGMYKTSAPLQMPATSNNKIALRGQGARDVSIRPTASCKTAIIVGVAGSNAAYAEIANISVTGIDTSGHTGCGIHLIRPQYCTLREVNIEEFDGTDGTGIYFEGSPGAGAPHAYRTYGERLIIVTCQRPWVMVNADENDFMACSIGAQPGLTSAVTALYLQQGRNNRFYGLLLAGENSSLTTGRPFYTGACFANPTTGDNSGNQIYGLVAEGFESGISIGSAVTNTVFFFYNTSINSAPITDAGTGTVLFAPQHSLTNPIYQWPNGTAIAPAFAFRSEGSLGWYRSATSILAISPTGRLGVGSGSAFGTAAAPDFCWTADTDTGMYRSSADAIDVVAGGTLIQRSYLTTGLGITLFQVGSATTPSIAFSNEPALGWFRSAASILAIGQHGRLGVGSGAAFGTSAAPDFCWTGDSNTGLNRAGTDLVDFVAGATRCGRWMLEAGIAQMRIESGSATTGGLNFSAEPRLGWYRSGTSTIGQSYGTFNLATNGVRLSMRTLAASAVTVSAANTNVATNEVVFTVGGASGASLAIHSGGTVYIFDSVSSAKAT